MSGKPRKPEKPRSDFPLFPHAAGKWAKKIKGKMHYFGRWDDPDGAIAEYERFQASQKTVVPATPGKHPIEHCCNAFLTAKQLAVEAGDLSRHSFADYHRTCKLFIEHIGKGRAAEAVTPEDFRAYRAKIAKTRSSISLGNEITRVRVLYKWLWDERILTAPQHFGPDFKRPSKRLLRRERRQAGKKLYSAVQIHLLLDECGVHLRAMILLGINCGFGNTDCARLPLSAVDIDKGIVDFPRPKTEIDRICPLWPETVEALRASLRRRYKPKDAKATNFFVRPDGSTWEESERPITKQFSQAALRAGLRSAGFYWLRHTFETIAGGSKDQVAVNFIMGHSDQSMAANYRQEIAPARLQAVVDHVRVWLFA